MNDDKQSLAQSCTQLFSNLVRLTVKLREEQLKAIELLQEFRFTELLTLNEAMTFSLQAYYRCIQTQVTYARKDHLALVYNRALFHYRSGHLDEASNLLLETVQSIKNAIEQQKSRMGFEQSTQQILVRESLQALEDSKVELAIFYYYLGVVNTQNNQKQVALASALKSLSIIQQYYQSILLKNRFTSQSQKDIQQIEIEELLNILKLRQNIAHSKQLQLIDIKTLESALTWILGKSSNKQFNKQEQFCIFGEVASLKLDEKSQNISRRSTFIKLQCLNYYLLSQIQSIKQNKHKNNHNNILLPAILSAYIYKQFLDCSASMNHIYSQFSHLESKVQINQPLNLHNLLEIVGIKLNSEEKQPLHHSCSDNLRVLIKSKSKQKKTNRKDRKIGSKKKRLSPKMKAINSPSRKQKQQRQSTKLIFPITISSPRSKGKNSIKAYSPTHYYLGSTTIENNASLLWNSPTKGKNKNNVRSKSKKNKDKLKNNLKRK